MAGWYAFRVLFSVASHVILVRKVVAFITGPMASAGNRARGLLAECRRHPAAKNSACMTTTARTVVVSGDSGRNSLQRAVAEGKAMTSAASLERIMDSLGDNERYNAVLQGLAGLHLSKRRTGSAAKNAFEEVFQLLNEMHYNEIKCTARSASLVIDAAAATTNVGIIAEACTKLRRTDVGRKFSCDLDRLSLLPTETSRRMRAIRGLVPVPDDDRAREIGLAFFFMFLVVSDSSWEGIGHMMHYDTTIPTLIGAVAAAAMAFDIWKRSGVNCKLVLSGLNRMFVKDVERESRAEAGAFLVAYATGLPCFPFQPSAVEALRMTSNLELQEEAFLTGNGIQRILVWLMAGVAGEGLVHRQMLASDPRQAFAFLQMVRSRESTCDLDPEDDLHRVQWAFNEALMLLRSNEQAFEALRRRLESGGATVGECVALIERRLI